MTLRSSLLLIGVLLALFVVLNLNDYLLTLLGVPGI